MALGDWLVIITILGLCFAIGWLDWAKPMVVYVQTPAHEIYLDGKPPP